MAPKVSQRQGKRVRRSPSPVRASSPPAAPTATRLPPAQDPRRFSSSLAERKWHTVIQRRPLLSEASFDLSDDQHRAQGVLDSIHERGWDFLLDAPAPVNASLVREFYANWHHAGLHEVFLRGRQIQVHPHAFRAHLGIPVTPSDRQPDEFDSLLQRVATLDLDAIKDTITYPGTSWVYNSQLKPLHVRGQHLTLEARIWMKFLFSHILPCTHVTNITMDQVLLLHCLVTGQCVYLPRLIHRHMQRVHHDKACNGLPYPSLITRIASAAAVPLFPDDVIHEEPKLISLQKLLPLDSKAQKKTHAGSGSGSGSASHMDAILSRLDSLQSTMTEHIHRAEQRQ